MDFELVVGTTDADGKSRTFHSSFEAEHFYHEVAIPYYRFHEVGTENSAGFAAPRRKIMWVAIKANAGSVQQYRATIQTQSGLPLFAWNRLIPTIEKLFSAKALDGRYLFESTLFLNYRARNEYRDTPNRDNNYAHKLDGTI